MTEEQGKQKINSLITAQIHTKCNERKRPKFRTTICHCPSRLQWNSTSTDTIQITPEYEMITVELLPTLRDLLQIWQFHKQYSNECSTSKITAPFELKVLHFTVMFLGPICHKYDLQFYKTTGTLQVEQEMYSNGESGTEGFILGRVIFWDQTEWLHYTNQQLELLIICTSLLHIHSTLNITHNLHLHTEISPLCGCIHSGQYITCTSCNEN